MIHFIVNENAQTGHKQSIAKLLTKEMGKYEVPYEIHLTSQAGDAKELARELSGEPGEKSIWVVGGDGTINEAVNGLYFDDSLTLAYLPAGSANDYARGLGLPLKLEACLAQLMNAKEQAVYDVGEVETFDGQGAFRFAGSSGIGYDATVCTEVDNSKLKPFLNKLHLGKLAYMIVAVKQVFVNPRCNMTLIIDGQSRTFSDVIFASFMNHCYEGGGLKMAPDANPQDGKVSVVMAYGVSPWRVLTILPRLFNGTHVKHPNVLTMTCNSIEVITDRKQYVHTDGEVIGMFRHLRINCGKYRVRMPHGTSKND